MSSPLALPRPLATPRPLSGLFRRLRAHFAALSAAQDAQRSAAALPADAASDSGIDPADLTGVPSWQPDLPFFLQSGFGRSDRR